MAAKLELRLRPAWALLGIVALCIAAPARAGPAPGPRLRVSSRGPVHAGDRIEFAFEGDMRGVDEFEILLSTDGGRTYPIRITEELNPATRRLTWRVPRMPCSELRLRVQFHRDGREIEGEESVSVPLIAREGGDDALPIPQAVETEGLPTPTRNRPSRSSGPETGRGENADREGRGPWTLQRLSSSTVVPIPPPLPRTGPGAPPDDRGAPEFVPPRK
jgi:hypothetical protein